MRRTITRVAGITVAATALGTSAMGQTTPPGHVYHLRTGSTEQQGCFGACQCPVLLEQPMRGRFLLTPTGADPLFENFAVSDVRWRVPSTGLTLGGSGTYRIGGEVALEEQMALDLVVGADAVRRFDSGLVPVGPGPAFPVITVQLAIPDQICWNIELRVNATPYMGDWNGDGNVRVQDLFDFIGSWFAGDGDANDDGVANVQDLFDFVNGWFAGT
jgi:hypothetical protein